MPNQLPHTDGKLKQHAQHALDALKAANLTIVTAESCTAGSIAALLAQAEGASDILHGGFTTYTKEHKTKALGVPWRLLKEQGAVNAEFWQRARWNARRPHSPSPSAACLARNLRRRQSRRAGVFLCAGQGQTAEGRERGIRRTAARPAS